MASVSAAACVSVIANGTGDLTFVKYPVSLVLITFGAYFVAQLVVRADDLDPTRVLLDVFIVAIVVQNVIAVLMFAFPPLMELANQLQSISSLDQGLLNEVEGARIVGFGSKFFDAGVVNGFGLILISYRLVRYNCPPVRAHLMSISFILLVLVGVMMARTTMVGFVLALALLVLGRPVDLDSRNKKVFFLYLALVPIALYIVYNVFLSDSDLRALVEFGFEIFFNMSENGTVESKSTNQLLDMYGTIEALPWQLGDGYFVDPFDPDAYYMAVDVGYLRLVLYFGVPGLVAYLCLQIYSICYSFVRSGLGRPLIVVVVVYLLVLNMKGFVDLYYLVIPFLLLSNTGSPSSPTPAALDYYSRERAGITN
jgi:hypothetical protein